LSGNPDFRNQAFGLWFQRRASGIKEVRTSNKVFLARKTLSKKRHIEKYKKCQRKIGTYQNRKIAGSESFK